MNNDIVVKEVHSKREMNDFISFPRKLYKNFPQYVPDMDIDIRNSFNPEKNCNLYYADVQPFIAYRHRKVVGRITAIISHKSNKIWERNIVRFTHIEFVDDINVSRALIEAVKDWGRQRDMDTIQGPMGITDYDKEGMLIEDFHLDGTLIENWNPPYYKDHMEKLGFEKDADWIQIRIKVPEEVPPRYKRVAEYAREEFGLHIVHKTKHEILKDGYGQKIFQLFNAAYAPLFGFAPFSEEQTDEYLNQYVPLLDLDIVPLIEDKNGDIVCTAITLKDLSPALKKSKGKILPTGWFHLVRALKFKRIDKAILMLIAVRPDMQGLGVNALVFDYLIPMYNKKGIKWCETGPQLEDNIKELSQWKPLHPETVKRRRCWKASI